MSSNNVVAFLQAIGNSYQEFNSRVVDQLAALGYTGPTLAELAKPHGWLVKLNLVTSALHTLNWTADELLQAILKIQQTVPGFGSGSTDYSVPFATLLKIELPLETVATTLTNHGAPKIKIAMWAHQELLRLYPEERPYEKRQSALRDILRQIGFEEKSIEKFVRHGHF